MRKIFRIFAIIVFLTIISFQSISIAERRNAFEFSSLYLSRLNKVCELFDIDVKIETSPYIERANDANFMISSNVYSVSIPAGTVTILMPECEIIQFRTLIMDFYSSEEERDVSYYSAAAAYSALEYPTFDGCNYVSNYKIDPADLENAATASFIEFFDATKAASNDPSYSMEFRQSNGSVIPLMSGNYEYSLQHECGIYTDGSNAGEPYKKLYLIAKYVQKENTSPQNEIVQAENNDSLNILSLIPNYGMWAHMFGVEINDEFSIANARSSSYIEYDRITVTYNPETLETVSVDFLYLDADGSITEEQIKKEIAFFSALEHGTVPQGNGEYQLVKNEMFSLNDIVLDAIENNLWRLYGGKPFEFYKGNMFAYSLLMNSDSKDIHIVATRYE